MNGLLLDPQTGRPAQRLAEAEALIGSVFDDERLSAHTNIASPAEFEETGRRLREDAQLYRADALDFSVLERLPKSVRRYMKLATDERKAGRTLKRGALVAGQTQAWASHVQPSNVMVADQTAIVGTTEALLYPFGFALVPGGWWQVGTTVKLTVAGKITTAGASPGNLTLTSRYGNTTAGTSLAASGALALQISQTNITWVSELYIVCRASNASGGTGTLIVIGNFAGGTGTTLFTTGPQANIPVSAPVTAAPDLSVANALLLDGTLGSASDSMTTQMVVPLAVC